MKGLLQISLKLICWTSVRVLSWIRQSAKNVHVFKLIINALKFWVCIFCFPFCISIKGMIYKRRSTLTYVCVCQSVVQRGIGMPPSSSLRLGPPLPGGNGCSGSLVPYGFCSASHRLQRRADVQSYCDWLHKTYCGNTFLNSFFPFLTLVENKGFDVLGL